MKPKPKTSIAALALYIVAANFTLYLHSSWPAKDERTIWKEDDESSSSSKFTRCLTHQPTAIITTVVHKHVSFSDSNYEASNQAQSTMRAHCIDG